MITSITSQATQEAQFKKVCELAIKLDIDELQKMAASGICINEHYGNQSPVMLLRISRSA